MIEELREVCIEQKKKIYFIFLFVYSFFFFFIACVLFSAHTTLPKEEWTKPEEENEYLSPYIFEVMEEDHDRATWRL